jgi:L-histidine Nalpha-methyltransferase / hercynylcysteine S-oxide synthase
VSDGLSGTKDSLVPQANQVFVNLEGTNVAFKHWHPVSVAERGDRLCGQADLGGAWEWTSSVLERWEGFQSMEAYPGYTGESTCCTCLEACANVFPGS